MPNQSSLINLIQTKAKGSARLAAIEQSLHKSAMASLTIFVALGIIVGIIFFFYSQQKKTLDTRRQAYIVQINAAKNKEGLLLSIKDRTSIVSRVLAEQRPWSTVLDHIATVVSPTMVSTVSVDQQNKFSLGFSANSLDEVLAPVEQLIKLSKAGAIKNPELISVQFQRDGTVEIAVSFIAMFN